MAAVNHSIRHRKQLREGLPIDVHGTGCHHNGGSPPSALQIVPQPFKGVAKIRVSQLQFVDRVQKKVAYLRCGRAPIVKALLLLAIEAQANPTGRNLLKAQKESRLTAIKKPLGLRLALVRLASPGFRDQQDALRLKQ